MDWASILTAILAAISVVTVTLLQRKSQENLKLRESLNERKQKFYESTIKFFANYLDGTLSKKEVEIISKRIRSTNQQIIYYAPSNVIRSYGDLIQHLYHDSDEGIKEQIFTAKSKKLFAELEVQIRKDLGYSSRVPFRGESWLDMLRISTTDIVTFVSKKHQNDKWHKTRPNLTYEGEEIR